ncbi:MAG: hypothetical protein WAS07_10415 [Micropruina sp.]
MPNHVENDLYITGPEADVVAALEFMGVNETPAKFDFGRIIPYPEPYASMDAEYQAIPDLVGVYRDGPEWDARAEARRVATSAYKAKWNTTSDGFNSGGYEWRLNAWGTKWGAYDVKRRDYDNKVIVTFQTAWSPPSDAIFAALAQRFPACSLTLEYFERGMGFCGGASWLSKDDWWNEDKPYTPSAKTGAWESREYCGVRGG